MTDRVDDELHRLRADLQATAAATSDPAATLADVRAGTRPTRLGARRRHDRLAVAGAAMLIAASLVAVAIVGGDNGRRSTVPGTTPDTASDTIASTDFPTTTVPTPPTHAFDIGAMSFIDAQQGWLVTVDQAEQTMALRRTTDGGITWQTVPTAGVPSTARPYVVTFADRMNGWLAGDGWYSTHDGGATWHALPASTSGYTPNLVLATGGYAYALSIGTADAGDFEFTLVRSPVGVDDFVATGLAWKKGAGGNDVTLSLVSMGDRVFASFNDRGGHTGRIVGSTADPTWAPIGVGRGGNIDFTTAPDGETVYLATQTGIWGGDAVSQLVVAASDASGVHFAPLPLPADLTRSDNALRFCGLRSPQDGTVVVLGCGPDGTVLIASADGGQSWRPTVTLPADATDIGMFGTTLIVYRTTGQPATLMVSNDSGLTFHQSFPAP